MFCMDSNCLFRLNPSCMPLEASRRGQELGLNVDCVIFAQHNSFEEYVRNVIHQASVTDRVSLVNMDIRGFPSSPMTVGSMQLL